MTYPCEPMPFQTKFGDVQMCAKCGHGPAPKECREPRRKDTLYDLLGAYLNATIPHLVRKNL